MRGRVPTGPTWFETSDQGIVNDLSISPQNTRTAIVNATQDLGSVPWIDGTDRQMVTRVCQATPLYHYIGDDRDLHLNTVQYVSTGMMTPSSILPRDLPVLVPLQNTSYAIYDAGPTRSSMTMGAPVSLGPGSERYDARMGGAADLTTGPTRPLPQGNKGDRKGNKEHRRSTLSTTTVHSQSTFHTRATGRNTKADSSE